MGIRSFLTQCFPPKPIFTEKDVPSQKGKVFIVTGGNSGVGFELCKLLYTTGATIYMASRSEKRALDAILEITESLPQPATPGSIKFLHLDLNDLETIQYTAYSFATQESKLDVLWNNAGTGPGLVGALDQTAQKLEPFVGVHCVATLLFTRFLEYHLRAGAAASPSPASVRVVWTSSIFADLAAPIRLELLENGTGSRGRNYAASKLGVCLLSRELAARWGEYGIVSVAQSPGNVKTNAYRGTSLLAMFFIKMALHSAKFGAYTELYAGLSPDITLDCNGAYIIPWGRLRADSSSPRQDLVKAMASTRNGGLGHCGKFWNWCEEQWQPFIWTRPVNNDTVQS